VRTSSSSATAGLGSRLDRLFRLQGDDDPDRRRIGRFVAIIAGGGGLATVIATCLAVLAMREDAQTAPTLALLVALCGLTLWILRSGHHIAAGRLLFLIGIGGTTVLAMTGRTVGFSDVAMMLYPLMVIAASLLLSRLESALGTGAILMLLGLLLAASLSGLLRNTLPTAELIAQFGFAVLIVAVSGTASRLVASSVERSEQEIRQSQAALAHTNTELREQTVQRQKLVRELEARNLELQHFTYTASHDLQSPLVTIGGFVGFLEKELRVGRRETLRSDLARIKQAQKSMSEILIDLLELSRAGRAAGDAVEVPFAEIVEQARALTEGSLAQHDVRLVVNTDLPSVWGHRRRLIQLMQNLLENAAKFSVGGQAARVDIGSRTDGGETVFYVRDEGIGIDPSHHQEAFELFRKLDPATPGTGIGLALVWRIVEAHGGRVWIDSPGAGRGTEVCFTLTAPDNGAAASEGH
jgi:signal transduction histidine kinase